jgi:hypothetical protein
VKGIQVVDEQLAGRAKGVIHIKIKDVTYAIKYEGALAILAV